MKFEITGTLDTAITHFALVGLANILQEAGAHRVRLWWQDGAVARPTLQWEGPDAGEAVLAHARRHADPACWLQARRPAPEDGHALFSPRLKPPTDDEGWFELEELREHFLDAGLTRLDQRMIVNLGEPGYWVRQDGQPRPDHAASRWEMKTRNRGEEFIGQRLAPLAREVSTWTAGKVLDGLGGRAVNDVVGKNKPDSRTPTGLSSPGPTDNALAWCSLWGISAFTLVPKSIGVSATAGAVPPARSYPRLLVVPVVADPISPVLWTALARSRELLSAFSDDSVRSVDARQLLVRRGVIGACSFPLDKSDNDSAPERTLLRGTLHPFQEDADVW